MVFHMFYAELIFWFSCWFYFTLSWY